MLDENNLRNLFDGRRQAGFSAVELVIVVAILLITAAIVIFQVQPALASYRLNTAAQTIAAQIRGAQQAAQTGFTRAQFSIDITANTFGVQALSNGTFVPAGPTLRLPTDAQFGFGGATSPPPALGSTLAQSTTILVNSQGRPIDASGMPSGTYVVYVTNQRETYALNVAISGRLVIWRFTGGGWSAR